MTTKKSIAVFAALTMMLFLVDFGQETGFSAQFAGASIISGLFQKSAITPEVLAKTPLNGNVIRFEGKSRNFFDLYLKLPESVLASHWTLDNTSIRFTELTVADPSIIMDEFLLQQNPAYQFNRINDEAFYLNQVPVESKTDNFLVIVINKTIFGFQYHPLQDHTKVLEIIDALGQVQ